DEGLRAYVITGSLRRGESVMDAALPHMVLADGILVTDQHIARLDHAGGFEWLAALRRTGSVAVPFESRSAIAAALLKQAPPLAAVPDELRIEIVDGVAKPRLRLSTTSRPDRLHAELSFDYGTVVSADAQEPIVRVGDSNRAVRRNLD